jgi:hypothetical protein
MPAYIIFDNKTLQEIAYFLPDNEAKFLQINGVGAVKYKKYGEQLSASGCLGFEVSYSNSTCATFLYSGS